MKTQLDPESSARIEGYENGWNDRTEDVKKTIEALFNSDELLYGFDIKDKILESLEEKA